MFQFVLLCRIKNGNAQTLHGKSTNPNSYQKDVPHSKSGEEQKLQ